MDEFETATSTRVHLHWTPLCQATQTSFIGILQPFLFLTLQRDAHTDKWKKLHRGLELIELKVELSLAYLAMELFKYR